jgi:hypothetical protein
MNKYLVTFDLKKDENSELAIAIRTKLEDVSPKTWVQVFSNQVAIQTSLSIAEIMQVLEPENKKTRISVVKFTDWKVSEHRSEDSLSKYGY